MLTSFIIGDSHCFVVTWDLKTGGVVSAIQREGSDWTNTDYPPPTYSRDGKMVAALSWTESSIISIYDVVSGARTHDVDHGPPTNLDPD
jgi:predicted aconitase